MWLLTGNFDVSARMTFLGLKIVVFPDIPNTFSTLQSYWQGKAPLLSLIFDNHDVTKHRHQTPLHGVSRQDPPAGFYEDLGLPNDPLIRIIKGPIPPVKETWISKVPKLPADQRPTSRDHLVSVESVELEFHEFIANSFKLALQDAQHNIVLQDTTLHS